MLKLLMVKKLVKMRRELEGVRTTDSVWSDTHAA